MKLKDLPQPIRELAEKRIREQGNEPDGEKDLGAVIFNGGFDWDETIEGEDFWNEVAEGNFTPFYERYPQSKQYTLEQLREEKIAVLVENKEQAKKLGIDLFGLLKVYYWSISRNRKLTDWTWDVVENWSKRDFTLINFSQVIIPEAKQELQNDELSANCRMLKYKPNQEPTNEAKQEAGVGTNCTPPSNPHYKQTTIEPITVIQDWKLSFCLGNVIKYIGRADHKGNKLSDLEKAADYLRMEIEMLKR